MKQLNVLVVEDDCIESERVKNLVLKINSENNVFTATSEITAWEICKNNIIDLFIIDVHLEDSSGFTFAGRLREDPFYSVAPIIFVTSYKAAVLDSALEYSYVDYIGKPYTDSRMIDSLNYIMFAITKTPPYEGSIKIISKRIEHDLNYYSILYFEATYRKVIVHTTTGKFETYAKLDEISPLLDSRFLRCHKGYIVNMSRLLKEDYNKDLLYFRDIDTSVPIGKTYRHDTVFKIYKWIRFWEERYA